MIYAVLSFPTIWLVLNAYLSESAPNAVCLQDTESIFLHYLLFDYHPDFFVKNENS